MRLLVGVGVGVNSSVALAMSVFGVFAFGGGGVISAISVAFAPVLGSGCGVSVKTFLPAGIVIAGVRVGCDGSGVLVGDGSNVGITVLVKVDMRLVVAVGAMVLVHVGSFVSVSVGGAFVPVGEIVRDGMWVAGALVAVTVGAMVGGALGMGMLGFIQRVTK